MEYPPNKRLKGLRSEGPVDPFEDEDFTQDDLEEIDIIASQAIVGDGQTTSTKRTFESISVHSRQQDKAPIREGRRTFAFGGERPGSSSSSSKNRNMELQRNDRFGNGQMGKDRDELYYSTLEEQQAELKRKLKEVEEQIMMKNGEIRVLRDSLKMANQEKEQQRQALVSLERDRTHIQSEKERELNKKVESLQSELHFKEAEMNKMRSKLQSSERGGRQTGTPVRNSVNSPGSHAFVTKETFSAELCVRPAGAKGQPPDNGKQSHGSVDREMVDSDAATNLVLHREGSALLNLLLQHPLEPSSLGLCHLLCISPDSLPGLLTQSGYTSPVSSAGSSTSSTDSRLLHRPQAHFYQLQSLAISGLAMLAQHLPIQPKHNHAAAQLSKRACPGAVHLLPLLAYHTNLYCQALESIDRSGKSPLQGGSLSGSSECSAGSTVEDPLSAQEELALAAMKALYHIVCESSEAVDTMLGGQGSEKPSDGGPVVTASTSRGGISEKAPDERQPQHPLMSRLLQLLDMKFISAACQREALMNSSLRTLCALAENVEKSQLWRLKVVMAGAALAQSLSLESAYKTVCLSMRFLALVVDCDEIAAKLCSHNYVCPLLRIFQYITFRPDKSITELKWSHLDVEVIRFLSKLLTQKMSAWAALTSESSCQCCSEVVRTVVAVLHRQWLSIKDQERHVGGGQVWASPGVQLLREALMLLHWLLLNDSSFSLHCLDVLHMYHQVVPAIRDTLRKIPDLSESEELAIEEICRPETEDVEDMDVDAGS